MTVLGVKRVNVLGVQSLVGLLTWRIEMITSCLESECGYTSACDSTICESG